MQCLRRRVKRLNTELWRFRFNWFMVLLACSLNGLSDYVMVPSLHQFVTSSANDSDSNNEPGLGLNELWYSWIVSIVSVGQLLGAVSVGLLTKLFFTKYILLTMLGVCCSGGILYAIGKYGWMLLIARLGIGMYQGTMQTAMRYFFGETCEKVIQMLPEEKQNKSTIKYTVYLFAFAITNLSAALGPGLTAIAVQIPGLDPFRWPGMYIAGHSAVLFFVILFFFREKSTDLVRFSKKKKNKSEVAKKKKVWSWRMCVSFYKATYLPVPLVTVLLWTCVFGLSGWGNGTIEGLENPIVSDYFGLSIEKTSYVVSLSLFIVACGSITTLVLLHYHVDARKIFVVSIAMSIVGLVVIGDWQSIGGDPCRQFENTSTSVCPSQETLSSRILPTTTSSVDDTVPLLTVTLSSCVVCDSQPLCQDLRSGYDNCTADTNSSEFALYCTTPSAGDANRTHCFSPTEEMVVVAELDFDFNQHSEFLCNSSTNASLGLLLYPAEPLDLNLLCDTVPPELECFSPNAYSCGNLSSTDPLCVAVNEGVDLLPCADNTSSIESSCVCEQFATVPGYHCFWNPVSRVTGQDCNRCREACLSSAHSIHFVQFCVGMFLFVLGNPVLRVTVTAIASDMFGRTSQGLLMGALVAAMAIGRGIAPLVAVSTYLAVDRHTWLPMIIFALLEFLALLAFLALYRTMKPQKRNSSLDDNRVVEDQHQLLPTDISHENGGSHYDTEFNA